LTKIFGDETGDTGAALEDQVVTDQRLGLSFLSLVDDCLSPLTVSSPNALAQELVHVAKNYELTLIDGGPLHLERNAGALIAASQAILFLSRASKTSRETAAFAASDLLQMANGRRCAAVLTMADA
jgi:hypothetical protein